METDKESLPSKEDPLSKSKDGDDTPTSANLQPPIQKKAKASANKQNGSSGFKVISGNTKASNKDTFSRSVQEEDYPVLPDHDSPFLSKKESMGNSPPYEKEERPSTSRIDEYDIPSTSRGSNGSILERNRLSDSGKVYEEFLNNLHDPSPYVQKMKIDHEKDKSQKYDKKNQAMKILEKMMASTYDSIGTASNKGSMIASLDQESIENVMMKIEALEHSLKKIDRQMKESEKEKHFLLQKVNDLESRALRMQKSQVLESILSEDLPTLKDIEVLDQMKGILKHQDDCTKQLEQLERQNKVMENMINSTEKILSFTPWFQNRGESTKKMAKYKLKKLRINDIGRVFFFNNKDPPKNIPHWTNERVRPMRLIMDEEDTSEDIEEDTDQLLELLRKKKKEEEKLLKVNVIEGEDDGIVEPTRESFSSFSEDVPDNMSGSSSNSSYENGETDPTTDTKTINENNENRQSE